MRYVLADDDYAIKDTLDLYQIVKQLHDVCKESKLEYVFCNARIVKSFDVEAWFQPIIMKFLDLADQNCLRWVTPAVAQEQYIPLLPPTTMFSSSVLDIFSTFHQSLDFIEKFEWKESSKKEKLAQKFIKTLSKSLKEYAQLMYEEFRQIMEANSADPLSFTREV